MLMGPETNIQMENKILDNTQIIYHVSKIIGNLNPQHKFNRY